MKKNEFIPNLLALIQAYIFGFVKVGFNRLQYVHGIKCKQLNKSFQALG